MLISFPASLNILAVRRHIVADIRGVLSDSEEEYPDEATAEEEVAPLSYQKLVIINTVL